MKKLFLFSCVALVFSCNNGGSEEPPSNDQKTNTNLVWKGRIMVKDSVWLSLARYNPSVNIGYDTAFAFFNKAGYTGDVPAVDEDWASYFVDSAGHVVSKGYVRAQIGAMGGGYISLAHYNPAYHIGYDSVYIIHVNK